MSGRQVGTTFIGRMAHKIDDPAITAAGNVDFRLARECLERCMRRRADWLRRMQALLEEEREIDELECRVLDGLVPREPGAGGVLDQDRGYSEAIHAYERRLIESALDACGGVQRDAAGLLGMRPTTLSEKLKRLGLRGARVD